MLLRVARLGDLRRRTLSWCRSTRISASNAARDRNSPSKAHQISLQRSLIDGTIDRFAGVCQLFWVCGRDRVSNILIPAIEQGNAELQPENVAFQLDLNLDPRSSNHAHADFWLRRLVEADAPARRHVRALSWNGNSRARADRCRAALT